MPRSRPVPSKLLRRAWLKLGKRLGDQLAVGAAVLCLLLIVCGVLFYVFERGSNDAVKGLASGFKWLTLTLLTAGSPYDITTTAGGVIYYLVLVGGLGFVAMATGAVASKLVEYVLRRSSGMGEAKDSKHIVICGWSSMGSEILRELHADEVDDKRPVVILAPLDSSPTRDELTTFIQGIPSNAEDLLRAGIDRASTAIILADHSSPTATADDLDARTLLTTLAVESINPNCYTCVEVVRSENRDHFERTKADELVVSAELTGALLASSAITHGLSRAISDLITHPEGNEFYGIPLPPDLAGRSFAEVLAELKNRYDCVLVAVSGAGQGFDINPSSDTRLEQGTQLLVIARTGFSP